MAGPGSQRRSARHIISVVLVWLLLLGLVGGGGGLCYLSHRTNAQWEEATLAVFVPVRDGDFERAYAALSAERRSALSLEEFTALIDHPAYRAVPGAEYPDAAQDDPNCRDGRVELEDGTWAVQIYLLHEDDQWRVHSFALQRPARVPLGTLLPECRFRPTTMAGYDGPGPERATKPTHTW